ncbi:MAG: efflux RND transporter permease subunit [Bryobacterales bacterium]
MSVTNTAIHRPVTIGMFFVAVALFGLVSLDRLPLNLLPDISYPSLTVQTDYEDAAPEEIESLLTRPIEEAVGVSAGLTRISSISRAGQSEVVLEFAWGTNMDLASLDVREKLDLVQVPRDAEKPVILRFDPSFDPIVRMQLSADMSLSRLRTLAEEELKKQLEAVDGVAAVKVAGGREEQIRIEIDEKRLAEMGVPITEVTNILRQENLNQASGSLYDLDANYLIRMLNEFRTVEEIRNIIVRDQNGRKIVLGDVAEVWRGVKDRGVISRYDGKESVELAIYKEGDANTVTVARDVKARLEAIKQSKTYPKEVTATIVFNQADFISESVDNVLNAALVGGLLAIVVLFIFLRDARSTLIIGLSIPISILATFAAMYQTGISLNIMSLGGVALGVGMLVDNSIVVLESVHRRRLEMHGERLRQAVAQGTKEVATAVTASTLTTVAVFLPLVFVEGVAGQLFTDQALTITYSLLASLAVSLTFIPMLLAIEVTPLEATGDETAVPLEKPKDSWPLVRLLGAVGRAFSAA